MSCNSSTYSSSCCPEVPYPSISSESVPSLIDNLVYALYGTINKSISSGRVVWDIPCDPATTPAEVPSIPRQTGEGLLCYIIRVFQNSVAVIPNVVQTNTNNAFTGSNSFTQNINASGGVTGSLTGAASLNVLKAGDTMTGPLEVPAGATGSQVPRASEVVLKSGAQTMAGSLSVAGGITGTLTGTATSAATLSTGRTFSLTGDVTGTSAAFDGSGNASIPATIASGATITSPVFAGTATGSLISKVIQGVTDASSATAGYVGEVISGSSSATSISSNTTTNASSITLTPGDWDISGSVSFNFSGTTVTANSTIAASFSTSSGTLVADQQQLFLLPAYSLATASPAFAISLPRFIQNVSVNTTLYLNVKSPTTSAGSMTVSSSIKARRVR